jgi:uncharacterized membrane protein
MPSRHFVQMALRCAGGMYPLLVFAACRNGIDPEGLRGLALLFFAAALPAVLASLWASRVLGPARGAARWLIFTACLGSLAAALWWLAPQLRSRYQWFFLFQDLGFFGVLAYGFGATLAPGREPLCTYFAGLVHPQLSANARRYTRAITVAWTAFFIFLAGISTVLFIFAAGATWAFFANVLTPVLTALFFVAENAFRRFHLPAAERVGLLETFAAIRLGGYRGIARNAGAHTKPAG